MKIMFLLFLMLGTGLHADAQRMYDGSGRQIGRVDGERFYDASGRQIGRLDGLRRMQAIVFFYFFM
jgi:hypothetical protein